VNILSTWKNLLDDPKLLWLVGLSLIVVSTQLYIPVPIPVDQPVREFWETIDALPPNSNVYVGADISAGLAGDTVDPGIVIIAALLKSDLDVIIYSPGSYSDPFTIQMLNGAMEVLGYPTPYYESPLYGERLVDLGFIPGGVTTVVSQANSIRDLTPLDRFGNSLDDMPASQGFDNAGDMDLIVGMGAGPLNAWPGVLTVPYDLPTLYLYHAGGLAMVSINYVSGQCEGYVAGVKQGAQLELLSGIAGNNMIGIVALVFVNGFALLGLVASNIYAAYQRLTRKEET
jgi:hypothetical protein